jgi:hypothetical protein
MLMSMRILFCGLLLLGIFGVFYYEAKFASVEKSARALRVKLRSDSQAPIARFGCEVFDDVEAARYPYDHLAILPSGFLPTSSKDTPTKKEEVPVNIRFERSLFGRERSYWQQQALVLVVDLENGKRVSQLVTLPDMRVWNEITITLKTEGVPTGTAIPPEESAVEPGQRSRLRR